MIDPVRPTISTPVSVPTIDGAVTRRATPTHMPAAHPHSENRRPVRATTRGPVTPARTVPTASALPCNEATARLTPSSSPSKGMTGPKPYKNHA